MPSPSAPDLSAPAMLLQALANAKRLHVMQLLHANEWDVTSLAERVGLSQSALSQHLSKLRAARLVSTRRVAQTVFYSCNSVTVAQILAVLKIDLAATDGSLLAA